MNRVFLFIVTSSLQKVSDIINFFRDMRMSPLGRFLPLAIVSRDRPLLGESGHWDASSKSPIYEIRERQQRVVLRQTEFYRLTGRSQAGTRQSVPMKSDSVCTVGSELSQLALTEKHAITATQGHRSPTWCSRPRVVRWLK